jgi:hypothetical protein
VIVLTPKELVEVIEVSPLI